MSRRAAATVALDTGPWIAWIEQSGPFFSAVAPVFRDFEEGRAAAITSVLTLLEVLTGAYRRRDEVLVRRYEDLFEHSANVLVIDVDIDIARRAAELRARHGLRSADAIHLATAIEARAGQFVTTDRRLARVRDVEVRVLRPLRKRPRR